KMRPAKPGKIAVINTSGSLQDPWVTGFYGELHRGISEEASRLDIDFDFFDNALSLKAFVSEKKYLSFSGVLGLVPETHADYASWRQLQKIIPCVNMMIGKSGPGENYVGTDEDEGMRILFKHLTAEGHRRFGFFAPFGYQHELPRFEAWRNEAGKRKLPLDQAWLFGFDLPTGTPRFRGPKNFSAPEKEKRITAFSQTFLDLKDKPDAVIFAADSYAYLFWEAALQRGLRVPEDLALAGIGDRSHFILPRERRPLTTIRQDHEAIGAMSVRVLSEMISGKRKSTHQHVLVPPTLRIRRSSLRRNLTKDPKEDFRRIVSGHIETHLADPRMLPALARHLGVSPAHFSKRFREIFGLSFSAYLLQGRLARAKFLLSETSQSVKKILEEIGYPNHRRFYGKFRAAFGATPQAFRDSHPGKKSK
ncbi:MAG: substrate-binding domain-containing protein, partial [Spirochaetia bacterium]|nr:substrate-binding domain-containing protein [Spirochaetia bacterium]